MQKFESGFFSFINFSYRLLFSHYNIKTDCYVSFNFPDQKQITTGIIPNDRNPRVIYKINNNLNKNIFESGKKWRHSSSLQTHYL